MEGDGGRESVPFGEVVEVGDELGVPVGGHLLAKELDVLEKHLGRLRKRTGRVSDNASAGPLKARAENSRYRTDSKDASCAPQLQEP
jgi:hypothetical protein